MKLFHRKQMSAALIAGWWALVLGAASGDTHYQRLTNHLDSISLTLSVRPFGSESIDPGGGLRSVLFYVGVFCVEPPMKWADGSFAGGSAKISEITMVRILDTLEREGFLVNAATYYSERATKPEGVPPAKAHIKTHLAAGWKDQTAELRMNFFEGDYYTDYVMEVNWDNQLVSLLRELSRITAGSDSPAESLLNDLRKTADQQVQAPAKEAEAEPKLPKAFIAAAAALFPLGLGEPKGGEYREVEVVAGDVWSGETNLIQTRGWVFPAQKGTSNQSVVCWNGLSYTAHSVGSKADMKADVNQLLQLDQTFVDQALVSERKMHEDGNRQRAAQGASPSPFQPHVRRWGRAKAETASLSHTNISPLQAVLLWRAGEEALAQKVWQQWFAGSPDEAEKDPFQLLASDWTWSLFDRAVCAHMRGDDQVALEDTRLLAQVRPQIEAELKKHRLTNGPFPSFLDPVTALLADQERRMKKQKRPTVLESGLAAYPNKAKRIAALMEDFDELAVRQMRQPGGLGGWSWNPTVKALIHEGNDAIQPLLQCLETDSDARLTRSISFMRDFFYHRNVHPVSEPVLETLHKIINATSFGSWASPEELAKAGTNHTKIVAAQIRAYWQKYGDTPLEERWYNTLADDKAGQGAWWDAINNIVTPNLPKMISPGGQFDYPRHSDPSPSPMKGESLRKKGSPTVSELMVKRAAQWKPDVEDSTFQFHDRIGTLLTVSRWDQRAAQPILQRQMREYLEVWKKAGAYKLYSGEFNAVQGWKCPGTARGIVLLTLERARANDEAALEEYAGWLRAMPLEHYQNWQDHSHSAHDAFEPMWNYPDHPAMTRLAEFLFNDSASWLRPLLTLTNAQKSFVAQRSATPLSGLPGFQRHLLLALADKTVVGSAKITKDSWVSIEDATQSSGRLESKPDWSRCNADEDVKFRLCDWVAYQLSRQEEVPKIEIYWREERRDEAVAKIIQFLNDNGKKLKHRPAE